MTPPIVLKSTDNEAPVMSGQVDVSRFFDAVLINGYGDKPGLGWTKEYSDPNPEKGAVYRSDSVDGNGFFYKFYRALASHYYLTVDAYEAMADYETGVFRFGPGVSYIVPSKAIDPTPRPWMIVGDKHGFYLIVQHNHVSTAFDPAKGSTTYGVELYYFGDFPSLIPADAHSAIVCASRTGYGGYNMISAMGDIKSPFTQDHHVPSDSKGDETYKNAGFIRGSILSKQGVAGAQGGASISPELDQMSAVGRIYLSDGVPYSLRGVLPGYYYPIQYAPFDSFASAVIPYEPDLQLFAVGFLSPYWGKGQFLLDLGEGFRA